MSAEKHSVALSSVIAAVFLTGLKIVIGIITGSLGILSEAAHSGLDLVAAVITFFAVKISDKPADSDHNYGHGKVESFSALIETLLLLITCIWVIHEASLKLFFGKSTEVTGTFWGIVTMGISIVVDLSRSAALKKAALKYGSQALEADALHFSTDVWSSTVVIIGLILVWVGDYFKIPGMAYADPLAALGVCLIVIYVSIALGKRTIDVLLDAAPRGMTGKIRAIVQNTEGVYEVGNVRIRPSGPTYFIDVNVGIHKHESHRVIHTIVENIRENIDRAVKNCDTVVSTYPVQTAPDNDREIYHAIKKIVDRFPTCTNIHNIHVFEVSGKKCIAIHLEVKQNLTLHESHALSHQISDLVQQSLPDVVDVSVNFEYVEQQNIVAEDVTEVSQDIIRQIEAVINQHPEKLNCHDVKVYRQGQKRILFLHCELAEDYNTENIEEISRNITQKIRSLIQEVESVFIHVEPMN